MNGRGLPMCTKFIVLKSSWTRIFVMCVSSLIPHSDNQPGLRYCCNTIAVLVRDVALSTTWRKGQPYLPRDDRLLHHLFRAVRFVREQAGAAITVTTDANPRGDRQ